MSKFAKLKAMLESKGKSSNSAGAIAASIGRKKYGNKAMALGAKNHISAATAKKELKK